VARTDRPAFSFQGHPEASPGPHDLSLLFEHFMYLMVKRIQTNSRHRGSAKQKLAGG
jgi:carbamoyl-phosphate synthase small subunit